jgi:hypothetical protein
MFVPVVDFNQVPLMPTTPARARRWIESGKATPFWKKGVFCVRLNQEPSGRNFQEVALGIDPGSKKEGLTVKSEAHTYLNVQADAVTHIKKAVEDRRAVRRNRRQRKTPYRKQRKNRACSGLPPSTKARWQWKLRLMNWLKKIFPITRVVVEDIKAKTKGQKRWDKNFSPLEIGKNWFYDQIRKVCKLDLFSGLDTHEMREALGLKKSKDKLAETFNAHCVDSWVLASAIIGGPVAPDNTRLLCVTPLRFNRRELHRRNPQKGGIRTRCGGTWSIHFKKGSIVEHPKYGVVYVGGTQQDRVSLCSLEDGKRLCRNAHPVQIKFLTYSSWRSRLLPVN